MLYGSIPAGGLGTRLQPIGFSKELAPVNGRAVIEYLIERLLLAGVDKIFINTAEDKTDLIRYLSTKSIYKDNLIYLVRERRGLLDGIVKPAEFLRSDDELFFGLPDTIWYPATAYQKVRAQKGNLVLGLFDTGTPERFDSVVTDSNNRILSIDVKVAHPKTKWTWAIGKLKVGIVPELVRLAQAQTGTPLFGSAMHAYSIASPSFGVKIEDSSCLDIGEPRDYRIAEQFVHDHAQ